jgi:hypothetical protein
MAGLKGGQSPLLAWRRRVGPARGRLQPALCPLLSKFHLCTISTVCSGPGCTAAAAPGAPLPPPCRPTRHPIHHCCLIVRPRNCCQNRNDAATRCDCCGARVHSAGRWRPLPMAVRVSLGHLPFRVGTCSLFLRAPVVVRDYQPLNNARTRSSGEPWQAAAWLGEWPARQAGHQGSLCRCARTASASPRSTQPVPLGGAALVGT